MLLNENIIVARGGWNSDKLKALKCSSSNGKHLMKDVSNKPGKAKGERIVTSACKHCGCRIVDCPTIYA